MDPASCVEIRTSFDAGLQEGVDRSYIITVVIDEHGGGSNAAANLLPAWIADIGKLRVKRHATHLSSCCCDAIMYIEKLIVFGYELCLQLADLS
mgnify:CR=1 FL=1